MANKPNNVKARGKGFYIAMYSGLAGLLVLAVAIGYNSLLRPDLTGNYDPAITASTDYGQESLPVSGIGDRPAVQIPRPTNQQDVAAEPALPYQNGRPTQQGQPTNQGTQGIDNQPQQPNQPGQQPQEQNQPNANQPDQPAEPNQQQPQQEAQAQPQNQPPPEGQPAQPPNQQSQAITDWQNLLDMVLDNWDEYFVQDFLEDWNVQQVFDPADQQFTAFTDNDDMHWPVLGDIVMDFSVDSHVFDPTLDQWRTSDSLSIAANNGDPVRAAADGRIQQVQQTQQFGQVVVIDHGNGWTTTYRQLASDVAVAVGDVVSRGQIIGSVGTPSIFAGGLGYHVSFNVQNNGDIINPHAILSINN
ncbi:MAG: M23 family metallopeptidase [Defluviitaleaceae bacterium]|nr:M23 family metallopeptidase [Defluviitaleaceae bacterium]